MKEIILTNGNSSIVDDDTYEMYSHIKWREELGYAVFSKTKGKHKNYIFLHRLANNTPDGCITDHINRNKLDNRRENLRTATYSTNRFNASLNKNNVTGYKGVVGRSKGKYQTQITINGKQIHLGTFLSLEDAANARAKAEEKAMLNALKNEW